MDSREFGLVLARDLMGVEDLHYGLWDTDLELSLGNLKEAQQRYTDQLIEVMPSPQHEAGVRVLDIGCGTGHTLAQMLDRGYRVDGVIPSASLASFVRERLAQRPGNDTRLFECRFQDVPIEEMAGRYDVALFSESFQYISMEDSFPLLQRLLKPGGRVVICDFFKTPAHGDGAPGDGSFGGGHDMQAFYDMLPSTGLEIVRDVDITKRVSPNLELLNDLLMHKLLPAGRTTGRYFRGNYPILSWLVARLFSRKFHKARYKYFSGHRSREVFERYKTYHLIILQRRG